MKTIQFSEIVSKSIAKNAIIRNDFPGFREDYLAIHCLITQIAPLSFVEIGTSSGAGTNVICNAMNINRYFWNRNPKNKRVYSIDVPPGTDPKQIYPGGEDGHPKHAGKKCKFPYIQLFGDSTKFDFSPYYPIDAWFIDGKHNYEYVKNDTLQALKSCPMLIIWHDVQIPEVEKAIIDLMTPLEKNYDSFRITDTRIAYATRK